MSDIAAALLAQYYGFSKNPETEKFLSIHECMSNAEHNVQKLTAEQSTLDTCDDAPQETGKEADVVENEESNSEVDTPIRSSRALEWEAFDNDNDEKTAGFDIIFEGATMNDLYDNTNASSSKQGKDLDLNITKIISTILGPEDKEENDLYVSLSEDALPNSASDISSTIEKKTSPKSSNRFASSLMSLQDKIPTYNETFVDLTSTGLVSLPIEIIKKYFTIRMLYLENNNLTELPKELFVSLPQLQWLDVRNNQLTSLPTSIQSHSSLETILLEANKIEKLPLELCLVPKLKILNVAHNPITVPPQDVIALGCASILNYLRAEWNKLHLNEPIKLKKEKSEPKLSTILCYQSPRDKQLKLPKISRRALKSANGIDDLSKDTSIRKRSRAYKPSNRYSNMQIDTSPENATNNIHNNDTSLLCASCARKLVTIQCKDESNKQKSDDAAGGIRDERNYGQHAFLNMITSCHDIRDTCIRNEITEVNAKILHLTGPSPRSRYVRQNVTGLITYRHYREKACKIKTISNETKYIALAKSDNSTEDFNEDKKKYRNTEHADLVFDIVTKDMQKMLLRPAQMENSRCILSCLENYLGNLYELAEHGSKALQQFDYIVLTAGICDGRGINIAMEQQMQWISKARDLFSAQSATIQKNKDADMIKEWRRDKRSFSKSMEKISKRNEDDIPFAINIENYPAIQKMEKCAEHQAQEKLKFVSPININKKLIELSKSLQKLEITESSEILTPKSKQKFLHTEIEKLSYFQKEIQTLRRYNEILTPMNPLNNSS